MVSGNELEELILYVQSELYSGILINQSDMNNGQKTQRCAEQQPFN
jgi:hypothetical protein